MSRSRVIADLRRHRGDARNIIGLVANFAASKAADADWLVRPDQAHLLPPGQIIGTSDQYDQSWSQRLSERIAQVTQNGPGGSFWVFSYDALIRAAMDKLQGESIPVIARSPAELIAEESKQRKIYSTTLYSEQRSATGDGVLTLQDAVEVAKKALRRGGHVTRETALTQAVLRTRMRDIDSRAAKIPGDASSETLIASIVSLGQTQGWMKRFRRVEGQSGTESIYLVEATASSRADTPTEPSGHIGERGKAEGIIESAEKLVPTHAGVRSDGAAAPKKHPNRSTGFEEELSRLRIGSMPETREMVFDAVETALASFCQEKPTLAGLFASAAHTAQDAATACGYNTERNWPIAVKCIQRLMLWAGVILDEHGKAVRDQLGSASSRVFSLAPDFRRRCEIYLAEKIIFHSNGISFDDDLYYLGLTLYRRGKEKAVGAEDLKAKTDELLAFMQENGLIETGNDRIIRIAARAIGAPA